MTAHARRAARLEHRLTRPTASLSDLEAAVALVLEHELDALTVSPWLVKPARRMLGRSRVRLGSVIGYPGGGQLPAVKAFEASRALEHGATQLDFVMNAGALVSGEEDAVLGDMLAVVEMAHAALASAGVVLEPSPLSDERLRRACRLAERAGATHVITAPEGIGVAGTIERARLLRELLGSAFAIKAVAPFAARDELLAAHAAGASILSTEFTPELAAAAVAAFALNAGPPLAAAV
jgi:deoxyribose-phosphate aldolase